MLTITLTGQAVPQSYSSSSSTPLPEYTQPTPSPTVFKTLSSTPEPKPSESSEFTHPETPTEITEPTQTFIPDISEPQPSEGAEFTYAEPTENIESEQTSISESPAEVLASSESTEDSMTRSTTSPEGETELPGPPQCVRTIQVR